MNDTKKRKRLIDHDVNNSDNITITPATNDFGPLSDPNFYTPTINNNNTKAEAIFDDIEISSGTLSIQKGIRTRLFSIILAPFRSS